MYKKLIKILGLVAEIGEDEALRRLAREELPAKDMDFCVFIDAGHGGINPKTGRYVTAPSKMFRHPSSGNEPPFTFYEGVFNREVCRRLEVMLKQANINFERVYHDVVDLSLSVRVDSANNSSKKYKKSLYLSIHGNAANNLSASGLEVFTSKGQTTSDKIAKDLIGRLSAAFPTMKNRGAKEANFFVLRKTKMPAVLSENGFFTNREEALKMKTPAFLELVARAHFESIKHFFNGH